MWWKLRLYLYRRVRLPLPAVRGWWALLAEFSRVSVWKKDGIVGAPLEWSLYEREPGGRLVSVSATCQWSGASVSGATPIVDEQVDLTHFGVRCARCGVPVHASHAGMAHSFSVPSCVPCRWLVKLAVLWGSV